MCVRLYHPSFVAKGHGIPSKVGGMGGYPPDFLGRQKPVQPVGRDDVMVVMVVNRL